MAMDEEDGKMDYYYNRAIECLILLLLTLFIAVHQQKKTFEALIAQQKSFLDSYNTYMKEMHESLRHNSSQTDYIPRELIELLRNDREQDRTRINNANVVQVGQTNHIVNNSAEPRFPTDFSSTNTREDNSRDDISSVPSHSSHQSAPTLDKRPFSAPPTAHSEHQVPDDQLVPNYISPTSTYSMSDSGNKEDEFEPSTANDLEYMNTYINAKPNKSFKNSTYDTLDRDHCNSMDSADEVYETLNYNQFRNEDETLNYYRIWCEDKIHYMNYKPSSPKGKKINWRKVKDRVQRLFKGKDGMEYDTIDDNVVTRTYMGLQFR